MSRRPVRLAGHGSVIGARATRCTRHLSVAAMASSATRGYGGVSAKSNTGASMRLPFSYMPFSFCRYPFFVSVLLYFQLQSGPLLASGFSVITQKAAATSSLVTSRSAGRHSRAVRDASRSLFVPSSGAIWSASSDWFPGSAVKSWSGLHSDRAVSARAWGCLRTCPAGGNVVPAYHLLPYATVVRGASRRRHRSRTAVTFPLPVHSFCSHAEVTPQQQVSSSLRDTRDSYALPASAGESGLARPSGLTEYMGTSAEARSPEYVGPAFTSPPCFVQGVRVRGTSRSRMERLTRPFSGVTTSGAASRLPGAFGQEENDRQVQQNRRLGEPSGAGGKHDTPVVNCGGEPRKTEQVQGWLSLSSLKAPLSAVRVGHGYDLHRITLDPGEATGRKKSLASVCRLSPKAVASVSEGVASRSLPLTAVVYGTTHTTPASPSRGLA